MRRAFGLILSLSFLALGSGLIEFLHNQWHLDEDRAEAAADHDSGQSPCSHPDHNDSNCPLHARLHFPLTVTAVHAVRLQLAFATRLPAAKTPLMPTVDALPTQLARAPPSLAAFLSN